MKKNDADGPRPKYELPPLIPAGEYLAQCVGVDKAFCFGKVEKYFLWFRIIEGEYEGTELFGARYYYDRPGPSSKQYQEWVITAGRRPTRVDRMSLNIFKGKIFKVRVGTTVKKDEEGKPLPSVLHYSSVTRILDCHTGP